MACLCPGGTEPSSSIMPVSQFCYLEKQQFLMFKPNSDWYFEHEARKFDKGNIGLSQDRIHSIISERKRITFVKHFASSRLRRKPWGIPSVDIIWDEDWGPVKHHYSKASTLYLSCYSRGRTTVTVVVHTHTFHLLIGNPSISLAVQAVCFVPSYTN